MRTHAQQKLSPAPADAVFYRAPGHRYAVAVSATGTRIRDADGNHYLDMSGGAAVSCVGHGHPDVIDAVTAQVRELAFAHTAFFTNLPQERLASMLTQRFGDRNARVYFLSGGSEANETALKLAWQYWAAEGQASKKIIISREHSYHGNTLGALSVSGNGNRRRASAAPLIDWPRIAPCYPYRYASDGESMAAYAERAAAGLDDAITSAGADKVAAFIMEPVVGSSLGVVPSAPGYLKSIRAICDRHNVLLIADEIMCGAGRTGQYFAYQFDDVRPDIVTLAKGIGGGYMPLAAAIVSARVASTLSTAGFAHGHTYVGHPVACAAGVAVQQLIDREQLLQKTRENGVRFLSLLSESFGEHPNVGEIRGRGLFAGIELVSDRDTRAGFVDRPGLADELRLAALANGLICYPGSINVDNRTVPHIMLAPPMIAEERHFLECAEKLTATFKAAL